MDVRPGMDRGGGDESGSTAQCFPSTMTKCSGLCVVLIAYRVLVGAGHRQEDQQTQHLPAIQLESSPNASTSSCQLPSVATPDGCCKLCYMVNQHPWRDGRL